MFEVKKDNKSKLHSPIRHKKQHHTRCDRSSASKFQQIWKLSQTGNKAPTTEKKLTKNQQENMMETYYYPNNIHSISSQMGRGEPSTSSSSGVAGEKSVGRKSATLTSGWRMVCLHASSEGFKSIQKAINPCLVDLSPLELIDLQVLPSGSSQPPSSATPQLLHYSR